MPEPSPIIAEPSLTIGNILLGQDKKTEWATGAVADALSHVSTSDAKATEGMLREALLEVLNVDLSVVLGAAWTKYGVLRKLGDNPTDAVTMVPIVDHKIQSKHNPVIEVKVGEIPAYKLKLEVDLSLNLGELALKVCDGKITEIASGYCEASGTLKWGKYLLVEKKSEKYSLPTALPLGDGIVIPPRAKPQPYDADKLSDRLMASHGRHGGGARPLSA